MSRTLRSFPRLAAAAAPLLLVLAGCGDPAETAALQTRVAELDVRVRKLESERDRLADRLTAAERLAGGLQEDLLQVRKDAHASAASAAAAAEAAAQPTGDPGSAAPAAGTKPGATAATPEAKALSEVLSTEAGRQVFEQAMKTYEARRDEERSDRMAAGLVDAFARRANLSAAQTEAMRKAVVPAFREIGGLWRSMRDQDMTPDERQAKQTEVAAKTEEIRQKVDDDVKGILDSTQYETYQQESARMRGMLGGGMGGFGGRGGFGGGRQQGQ